MSKMWKIASFALKVYLLLGFLFPQILLAADGKVDFRWRADTKFQVLMENSQTIADNFPNAFWQLSNALRAMVYYCQVTKRDCKDVGTLANNIFLDKTNNNQDWWWDDYGWSGLLFVHLYELSKDPKDKASYLELAELCLSKMLPSRNAWNNAAPDVKAQQKPRYSRGCYNTNLVLNAQNDGLTGIENTVMNALFLNLSLELFQIYYNNPTSPQKEEKARFYWNNLVYQYNWFTQWFANGLFNNSFFLVEERISTYEDLSLAYDYHKNRFWLGDQGLILRGWGNLSEQISQLLEKNPLKLPLLDFNRKQISKIFSTIADAIPHHLVDNEKNLLPIYREADDKFPFGDQSDYDTGPGNFMVNLFTKTSLEEKINFISRYKEIILVNATKAASQSDMDPTTVDAYNFLATELALISTAILAGM